jgi:hypothetical protein
MDRNHAGSNEDVNRQAFQHLDMCPRLNKWCGALRHDPAQPHGNHTCLSQPAMSLDVLYCGVVNRKAVLIAR